MTELETAVKEWSEARRAFLDVPPIGTEPKARFPSVVWNRLANAEDRLFQIAKKLD